MSDENHDGRYRPDTERAREAATRERVAKLDAENPGWRDEKHSNGLPKYRTDGTPLDFVGTPYGSATDTADDMTVVEGKPIEVPSSGVLPDKEVDPTADERTIPPEAKEERDANPETVGGAKLTASNTASTRKTAAKPKGSSK